MKTEIHLVSHSKDPDIRQNSSSGGFCKSFLTYLVESKTVDYIIMTRMKEDSTEPESIITNDVSKIQTRSNSIYEYHDQTKILKNIELNKKYCFIGLPCFVRYIRNQQIKHNKYKNVFPLISILCNQAPKSSFKNSLMNENNIQIDQVSEIDYRHGEYPGEIIAKMKNESLKNLGLFTISWAKHNDPFFKHTPDCCLNCELFESVFADIVVGDPWLTKYETDTKGWTKVIVRNHKCMNLIQDSEKQNYIITQILDESEKFFAYKHTKDFKQYNQRKHD